MAIEFVISYDMRAPDFGAKPADLYAAALDQVQWADELGFHAVGLGEHHCSPDGYNPSPIPLACAMAGRTSRILFRTSVLLAPLYDLVKLAEDLAVAQLATGGRILAGVGAGYRPAEFEMFGRDLGDRWRAMGEACEFLKLAWTGEPFEWQGRRVHVTPKPEPPPPLLLGGSSKAAARRAAHIADGWFPPLDARLWQPYREECVKLGKPDPGPYPTHAPIFLWTTKDVEAAKRRLFPHCMHQMQSYAEWTIEAMGEAAGPYANPDMNEDTLWQSGAYSVVTPEEAIALAKGLGDDGVFYLNPLLSGIDPKYAAEMLDLFEREVWPHIRN
jgi:alkanesulfonate monooxygenase SsuD/methylene tetrahydromethanopterin reductase-like flavin-dependent oxidoreductase (luciferase family)